MTEPDSSFWEGREVVVTGGAGFLGKATVRLLEDLGSRPRVPRSSDHDLTDARACREALEGAEIVIHLAANVGGIGYNRRNPAPLIRDNLAMGLNVFDACLRFRVEKLVAACSVCAYPKFTDVPFKESDLWSGYPEESNAPYGLAKKMLIVLSESYRSQYGLDSCVPVIANLYGPGDNFDPEDSHVIAAMVNKFVSAADEGEPTVTLWGTGDPSREFLYVDDAARALLLAAEHAGTSAPFNVGTGVETKIRDLAEMIKAETGYTGEVVWDSSRPDGQPIRSLDVSAARQAIGFEAVVDLSTGLRRTIESFRDVRRDDAEQAGVR
jgi:GDP-L-fucose synthase